MQSTTSIRAPFIAWMCLALTLGALPSVAADIVLQADRATGRDNVWQKRAAAGKPSWGIKGTGKSLSGSMWFDAFPGATGKYQVELGAVFEFDGQPEYKISAGGKALKSGKYPYSMGSRECNVNKGKDKAAHIDLGTHEIKKGDKIEVWGKSVYPCGSHGAYARWWEIRFVPKEHATTIRLRMPEPDAAVPWNPIGGDRDALGRDLKQPVIDK